MSSPLFIASTLNAKVVKTRNTLFDDVYEFPTHLLPEKMAGKNDRVAIALFCLT